MFRITTVSGGTALECGTLRGVEPQAVKPRLARTRVTTVRRLIGAWSAPGADGSVCVASMRQDSLGRRASRGRLAARMRAALRRTLEIPYTRASLRVFGRGCCQATMIQASQGSWCQPVFARACPARGTGPGRLRRMTASAMTGGSNRTLGGPGRARGDQQRPGRLRERGAGQGILERGLEDIVTSLAQRRSTRC